MTKKDFDKMGWNATVYVDTPDGPNKRVIGVDFQDDTIYVELAPKLKSWYDYKEIALSTPPKKEKVIESANPYKKIKGIKKEKVPKEKKPKITPSVIPSGIPSVIPSVIPPVKKMNQYQRKKEKQRAFLESLKSKE